MLEGKRRSLMVRGTTRLIWVALLVVQAGVVAAAEAPVKALLITGGCCHDYPRQKEIIPQGVAARTTVPIDWSVVLDDSNGGKIPLHAKADWADGYDVVVHNECFAGVRDKAWVENILKPHREGTPAVVVHCAMHSYRTGDDRWFEFLGVTSRRHGRHYSFDVLNLAKDHDIMKGFGDSWTTPKGELYLVEKVWKDVTPLAHAMSQDTKKHEVCVWTNQYGKGRVFGTTIGHHNETMADAPFLNMLTRGLFWSMGRLDEAVVHDAPPFDLDSISHIPSAQRKAKAKPKAKSKAKAKGKVGKKKGKGAENLARGKKASAPRSQGGHPPAHAIDGDVTTRWCSPDGKVGHLWQLDLGSPQELTGAVILWEYEQQYQYTVEGSADGNAWRMLSDQRKRTGKEQLHQLAFSAKEIRHIRVIATTLPGTWGSFWEFEALGTKIVERPLLSTDVAAVAPAAKKTAVGKGTGGGGLQVPKGLVGSEFSSPALTPCVACLGVTPGGVVFAGVDGIGSLGKGPGHGKILRLVDKDQDGVHDTHTEYAQLDNPRGLIPVQDKVFVLHTEWSDPKHFAGMHLSVLTDANGDGKADGPPESLVRNISTRLYNQQRGADHTTNGITLGIDGWIYVAVGDFGMENAVGTDGRTLNLYGGGIVRVRPDGTELEVFTQGMRNIYDMAMDPYLNIFTRGNTNDGGGWNVRFTHHIQSAEYGYPRLFKRYTSEILPALADVGGGSGTGAMFFDEPGWPKALTAVPLMCDWGRSQLFIHRVTADGPSYTQEQEEFIRCNRITDVDCDGSGRLFLGSWGASGFTGGTDGFVARVVPEGWTYRPFPDLQAASDAELANLLRSASAKTRLYVQQEVLRRGGDGADVLEVAQDAAADVKARIAAIFTLKQLLGTGSHADLLKLVSDASVGEYAIRALGDRKGEVAGLPLAPFVTALESDQPRVQVAAAVALGRIGNQAAAGALLAIGNPPVVDALPGPGKITPPATKGIPEGPHAKPNAACIVPHIARQALVAMDAGEACVQAIGGPNQAAALMALRYMHDPAVVDALIARLDAARNAESKLRIAQTLVRLANKERVFQDLKWWGTRPDTRGPYYYPTAWEKSEAIAAALKRAADAGDVDVRHGIAALVTRDRVEIKGLAVTTQTKAVVEQPKVNVAAVKTQKGQVGEMSLEDVLVAVEQGKGTPAKGPALFTQQACNACHALSKEEAQKGPYLGQIGSIMNAEKIAESILRPNAEISQGFKTVQIQTKQGAVHLGFVTDRLSDRVEIRDIAGMVTVLNPDDIVSETLLPMSMMPPGLANGMSLEDFVSLVHFLASQKK